MVTVHIFRRDLRLADNTALLQAAKLGPVHCAFIMDPRQINGHDYFSQKGKQFLIESLQDLRKQCEKHGGKLSILEGQAEQVIKELITAHDVTCISFNADYTPFSKHRDEKIKKLCAAHNIKCIIEHDLLLNSPGTVLKSDGNPYTIFTPYYRRAKEYVVHKPQKKLPVLAKKRLSLHKDILDDMHPGIQKLAHVGGRTQGMKLLARAKKLTDYTEKRDTPAANGTTHLAAHNKFGTVSIREVYHALKENEPLTRQLYWRDFFTHIAWHFPHVFGNAFQKKYRSIQWEGKKEWLEAWKQGKTGFPIIDAGMRQLVKTGNMHNRVRMIVASFLVKDLLIDWQEGEKFFAQHLIDYDPCVNNGSWQWAASTGCDAQPYFRIFNPWRQQKRFDNECTYIKKWVEELARTEPQKIHKHNEQPIEGYTKPIVEHSEMRDHAKALFASQ